jgi:hypothetical protein
MIMLGLRLCNYDINQPGTVNRWLLGQMVTPAGRTKLEHYGKSERGWERERERLAEWEREREKLVKIKTMTRTFS